MASLDPPAANRGQSISRLPESRNPDRAERPERGTHPEHRPTSWSERRHPRRNAPYDRRAATPDLTTTVGSTPGLSDPTVTALVSLARCLSGHTKLLRDLGPADPKADGAVDEGVKLSLYRVSCRPGALEPFQDLRRGSLGRQLRRARGVHCLVLRLAGARLPRSLCRSAPRLPHAINDARLPTMRVSLPVGPKNARGSRKARAEGTPAPALAAKYRTVQCDADHILLSSRSLAVSSGRLRSVAYISDSAIRSTGICIAAAMVAQ